MVRTSRVNPSNAVTKVILSRSSHSVLLARDSSILPTLDFVANMSLNSVDALPAQHGINIANLDSLIRNRVRRLRHCLGMRIRHSRASDSFDNRRSRPCGGRGTDAPAGTGAAEAGNATAGACVGRHGRGEDERAGVGGAFVDDLVDKRVGVAGLGEGEGVGVCDLGGLGHGGVDVRREGDCVGGGGWDVSREEEAGAVVAVGALHGEAVGCTSYGSGTVVAAIISIQTRAIETIDWILGECVVWRDEDLRIAFGRDGAAVEGIDNLGMVEDGFNFRLNWAGNSKAGSSRKKDEVFHRCELNVIWLKSWNSSGF